VVLFVFLFDFGIVQCGIVCFSIRFWNCSDSVVLFVFLIDFGIVQTVSEQFQNQIEKQTIPHCLNNSKI
jgi:hypothetical protein